MLVLRTVCTTDWKNRPNHRIVLVAKTENRKEAIEAMDKDVEGWQAADLAYDLEDGFAEPSKTWETSDRYEMSKEIGQDYREFLNQHGTGNLCTTVYHLLEDDHSYTEAK